MDLSTWPGRGHGSDLQMNKPVYHMVGHYKQTLKLGRCVPDMRVPESPATISCHALSEFMHANCILLRRNLNVKRSEAFNVHINRQQHNEYK